MDNIPVRLFFITFIIILSHAPGYCQTAYSLHDLSVLADKHSETIKIAQEDVFIAQQDKARALSVLIPRATAFGNLTKYRNDDASLPYSIVKGIKLTQSFTLNGKELIALDVTKKTIESKKISLETIRSQYLLQVVQAYYNILSARKFFDIAQSDVNRLTTHKNAVKEKLAVGNVTKTDLYRAEAELSKSLTERVKAENGILQGKAVLRNLVDIEQNFTLQKEVITGIENYQSSLDDIRMYALNNRTEIKEAKKNLEIARKTIKFKKSDYWPVLSLEAGYKRTKTEYNFGRINVDSKSDDKYLSGELVFTLFDGGLRRAEIRQAVSDERKAIKALQLQEKKIILDATTSYLAYDTAKSTLLNLKHELKSARENFNAVKMQFKYGMADSIDMMDANTLLVTAQRRISDAKYTYYLSVFNILYTRGDLISFLLHLNA